MRLEFGRVLRPWNPETVEATIADLDRFYALGDDGVTERNANYERIVNGYYDVVTDLYEFAWGDSFHFAPRYRGEHFRASIARHQHYIASRLDLREGQRVLDLGCGVGGPMRQIARFSQAHITGVNNHPGQVERARAYNEAAGLQHLVQVVKADFMDLPFEDEQFDHAYAIEALCHAPDRTPIFSKLRRVLRRGGLIAGYEWCMTESYRPDDARHVEIRRGIEKGVGVPHLTTTREVVASLERAGFEVLDSRDLAPTADRETPWYLPLETFVSRKGFRASVAGQWLTHVALGTCERLRLAPPGAQAVSRHLMRAGAALVEGGESGTFTPMFFFLARRAD